MVRKVIKNRLNCEELRDGGVKIYPMEEILGNMKTVREFASFGIKNKENLEVLRSQLLLDFCEGTFNSEEFKFFRMGLDSIMIAFKNSEYDTRSYIAENSNSKRSVG